MKASRSFSCSVKAVQRPPPPRSRRAPPTQDVRRRTVVDYGKVVEYLEEDRQLSAGSELKQTKQ
ncbi:hypothetical protein NECAME_02947 [Necator americanus]|uniref:Uncharacterized protein n=1 Tax=Necator americanus TaxID=51031 RepID=W2TAM3_NECAM|nr:hypothetical protein NECAME_02947 [Necator americanus]ETN78241.1 hypothetical protein NECAME_02947 [Necator americanus]